MGSGKKKISFPKGTIPAFIGCFALMSVFILSPFTLGGFLTNLGVSAAVGYFYGKLRKIGKIRFGLRGENRPHSGRGRQGTGRNAPAEDHDYGSRGSG